METERYQKPAVQQKTTDDDETVSIILRCWFCSTNGCDQTGRYERILQKLVGPDN